MNSITINQFINNIQNLINQEERIALTEKFNQLCEDTQNLFIENSIIEEEIQAEIDAYRRGE